MKLLKRGCQQKVRLENLRPDFNRLLKRCYRAVKVTVTE
jgi:hypothetical protein